MDFVRKRKSNEARLQAMQDRMKYAKCNDSIITASLKGGNISKSNHVTFESDSDSDSNNKGNEKSSNDINGNTRKDIFKETDLISEDEGEYKLPDRPQFEGKFGAKLFKLQRQAGNDDRFKMDERFVDSSSETSETESESRVDLELEEKQNYLKILGKVLGKEVRINKKQTHEIKDVIRFDPTQESHKKYILEREENHSPKMKEIAANSDQRSERSERSDSIPKVSNQIYYECQSEIPISSLFENPQNSEQNEATTFDFQIPDSERIPTLLPYTAEGLEEGVLPSLLDTEQHFASDNDEGEEVNDKDPEVSQPDSSTRNLFFFHANNPRLRNRLDEVQFYRQQDMETLVREWHTKAVSLVQDCKRKHRDAVRWKRKSLSSK